MSKRLELTGTVKGRLKFIKMAYIKTKERIGNVFVLAEIQS